MKSICKLTLAALAFVMIFTASELKAQDKEDDGLGLTVGIDYVSNYIYRGQYYYFGQISNGGMISPYAFYDILKTGLSIGIKGEIIETWFWDGKDEMHVSEMKMLNSMDFNINYMHEFKKAITFNIGSWYYAHRTVAYGNSDSSNPSYFDIYCSASIDALLIQPRIAMTYSYFTDKDYVRGYNRSSVWGAGPGKNGDFYLQLGLEHNIFLAEKTFIELAAEAGFFKRNTSDNRRSYKNSVPATDISDIDLSAGISTTAGVLTLSSSFHYVIVPGTQYKHDGIFQTKDIHRFYAKFGISCSI